jgi:biotin transport system substrate-specific component
VPVFHSSTGGLGVLAGPTGGFLIGFLVGAVLGSLVRRSLAPSGPACGAATRADLIADVVAAFVVIACIYLLGWLQLAAVAGISLREAFALGVAPFVVIDLVKAGVAIVIARAVRRTGVV